MIKIYISQLCIVLQCSCRCIVSKDVVRKPAFPVTLTKGGSSGLLRKSAVGSSALAQPFCINRHAVGDLPQRLHAQDYRHQEQQRQSSKQKTNLQTGIARFVSDS